MPCAPDVSRCDRRCWVGCLPVLEGFDCVDGVLHHGAVHRVVRLQVVAPELWRQVAGVGFVGAVPYGGSCNIRVDALSDGP